MAFAGWVLRGEIKERGGGDAGPSAMTSDAEIARNPHQPEGWRRNDLDFIVAPPPRCTQTSRRRRARHKRRGIPGMGH